MDLRANTVVRGSGRSFSQAQFWKNASFSSLPGLNWRNLDRRSDLECYYTSALAPRAATPVMDGKPLKSARKPQVGMADAEEDEPIRFHKDLSLLPKPLTAADLFYVAGDGSKVWVAYQGLLGAYSEDAALKAYPNCKTVPCDEFEAAF